MKTIFAPKIQDRSRRVIIGIGVFYIILVLAILVMARFATAAPENDVFTVSKDAFAEGGFFFVTASPGRYMPAPILEMKVKIDISGPVVRVKVVQTFRNPTANWMEGVYTFPLPEKSAVDRLTLIVGDRTIKGEIQEKEQAKKTYQQAKRDGKRASLVSQERPNIFTNSVANIGPGETLSVEIEYQDTARFLDGEFELRFPMVIRPRYIPGNPLPVIPEGTGWSFDTDQVPDASRITPPIANPYEGSINPVEISVDLNPGFAVGDLSSPSHGIKVKERRGGRFEITLKKGEVPADSDFVLTWRPLPGVTPVAGRFTEKIGDNYYHLFMIIPRNDESTAGGVILPREVIYIIDVSGSMQGEAIRQAKAALLKALEGLKPSDRFNIIAFNNNAFELFSGAVPASEGNLENARNYVSRLIADGGTEMASALDLALQGETGLEYLRQVIFITDGSVGNEAYLLQMIDQRLGGSRLFTIGIGSAPNSYFMREAAAMGKGTFTYIGNLGEVDEKMHALFRKLETPLLKDINIIWPDRVIAEIYPSITPDLYNGEPIMILARTENPLTEGVIFSGRIAGADWYQELTPDKQATSAGVAALWARDKIRDISNQALKAGTFNSDEMRQNIIDVALAFQLVSKYTSLVAVDDLVARPKDKPVVTAPAQTNLPKDMDPSFVNGSGFQKRALAANSPVAVVGAPAIQLNGQVEADQLFYELPQTATGLWQKLLLGFISLMSALVLLLYARKRKAGCRT